MQSIPSHEIVTGILSPMVARLGVKEENRPEPEQMLELAAFLQTSFGHITTTEIGIAVELLFSQELKDGNEKTVMPNTYQDFGLPFVSGWFVGYNRYRTKAIADVRKILPEPESAPENEIERHWYSELETRVAILAAYYDYQDFDRFPEQVISATMFQYIEAKGWFAVSNEKKKEIWREAPQHLSRRLLGGPNTTKLLDMFNAVQKDIDLNENKYALQTISRAQCLKLCFRSWNSEDIDAQGTMNLDLCAEPIPEQEQILSQVRDGVEPTQFSEAQVLAALYNDQHSNS